VIRKTGQLLKSKFVTENRYTAEIKINRFLAKIYKFAFVDPHRGLPSWRGGGAYAPMTRTIF